MSSRRVALRYAQPLIELAEEKGVLEEVKTDMDSFSSICKENREFDLMLKSPIISHLKKAQVLKSIFQGKVNELTLQALDIITKKNRESILPEIADGFVHLYNTKAGLEEVSVITSYELSAGEKAMFEELAKKITGKTPVMSEIVDERIIGGFQLKFKDQQLDQSVAGQLKNLKLKFLK